jgi:glycosyltransferase involved in cell wall biosynthesis
VACQTFADREFIIVDGNSGDGSVEVVKRHADKIGKWVSEPDSGIYNAMNKGIRMASGEYCYFLNSGDALFKDSTLADVFAKVTGAPEIIHGRAVETGPDGKPRGTRGMENPSLLEFLSPAGFCHQAVFYARELFYKHHFYDESRRVCPDKAFHLEVFVCKNATAQFVPEVFAYYDTTGVSSLPPDPARAQAERREAYAPLFPERVVRDFEHIPPWSFFFGKGENASPGKALNAALTNAATRVHGYEIRGKSLMRTYVFMAVFFLRVFAKMDRIFTTMGFQNKGEETKDSNT